VKNNALGGQHVSSTIVALVVFGTLDPAATTCWSLTWYFHVLHAVE
jgi:hypothetical protein